MERGRTPLGQIALLQRLELEVPPPQVQSYAISGARRTEARAEGEVIEWYPQSYYAGESLVAALRFALRYEPLDLRLLTAAFQKMDGTEIANWVREEPTGGFSRRAWFLYEVLTGRRLDLPDATAGSYVPALLPKLHFVADRRNSRRHRVIDNLLGDAGMYVTVRRTRHLERRMKERSDLAAAKIVDSYDPATLIRAIQYLYTKETRSSFAIEGEHAPSKRTERFIAALRKAPTFDLLSKSAFIELQGNIVDPRYRATDWRKHQNFVGETIGGYRERIHYVCPKPDDVPMLMEQWMAMARRLLDSKLDPVVVAAILSFSFVFIHPFEDGNGRIHRFLIHAILARKGFSPPNTIFPISASIARSKHLYDETLESFSKPLNSLIDWHLDQEANLVVEGETIHLYQRFDATRLVEFLYDRVADTVEQDLLAELGFLAVYDRSMEAAKELVDMPDRRLSLLVRLCMQNGGRLARGRRKDFAELTDDEIRQIEQAVQAAKAEEETLHPPGSWNESSRTE